jgi:hypothetical protein
VAPHRGKIQGNRITGVVTSPDGLIFKIDLTVDGDKMNGEANFTGDGQAMKAKIELSKVKS